MMTLQEEKLNLLQDSLKFHMLCSVWLYTTEDEKSES